MEKEPTSLSEIIEELMRVRTDLAEAHETPGREPKLHEQVIAIDKASVTLDDTRRGLQRLRNHLIEQSIVTPAESKKDAGL